MKLAPTLRTDQHLLVNLSGRGDKDIGTVADLSGPTSTAGRRAGARPSRAAHAGRGPPMKPASRHSRRCRRRRRKALIIPYVTAGDPHADATAEIMLAMVGAGADVIELGMPFSDPMADGR